MIAQRQCSAAGHSAGRDDINLGLLAGQWQGSGKAHLHGCGAAAHRLRAPLAGVPFRTYAGHQCTDQRRMQCRCRHRHLLQYVLCPAHGAQPCSSAVERRAGMASHLCRHIATPQGGGRGGEGRAAAHQHAPHTTALNICTLPGPSRAGAARRLPDQRTRPGTEPDLRCQHVSCGGFPAELPSCCCRGAWHPDRCAHQSSGPGRTLTGVTPSALSLPCLSLLATPPSCCSDKVLGACGANGLSLPPAPAPPAPPTPVQQVAPAPKAA